MLLEVFLYQLLFEKKALSLQRQIKNQCLTLKILRLWVKRIETTFGMVLFKEYK